MAEYEFNKKEMGGRISKLRGDRSQRDTAADMKLHSWETLRQWENGDREIKAKDIVRLSKHYGVSSDYILGLSDIKNPEADAIAACKYTGLAEKAVMKLHDRINKEFCASDFDPGEPSIILKKELSEKDISFINISREEHIQSEEKRFLDKQERFKYLIDFIFGNDAFYRLIDISYENALKAYTVYQSQDLGERFADSNKAEWANFKTTDGMWTFTAEDAYKLFISRMARVFEVLITAAIEKYPEYLKSKEKVADATEDAAE